MICAVDSMIVIWGFRSPQDSPDKAQRVQALFAMLADEDHELMVSAVSVSEVLIPIPKREHGAFLAILSKSVHVAAFDVRAASLAAELYQQNKGLAAEGKIARKILKADTLIIASIFTSGAKRFYSHDAQCRAIASSIMDAYDLPTHDEQMFR